MRACLIASCFVLVTQTICWAQTPENLLAAEVGNEGREAPPAATALPSFAWDRDGGRLDRLWGSAEYLLWWVKGQDLPPLVTTSPEGTPIDQAGVPEAGATTIFGGSSVRANPYSGGRFALGYWVDNCTGVGGEFFFLGRRSNSFVAASDGATILARPIFDATLPGQAAQLVAFPNVLAGQVSVNTSTELLGADVYLRRNLFTTAGGGQLDGLVGYRFLQMRETLGVAEALVSLEQSPLAPPVGTTFDILDQFRTSNYFHGGDIGLQYQVAFDRISIDVMARVAFGCTQRNTRIQGGTRVTQPGAAPEDLVGGLLALESNIGSHSSSGFSVVPELRLNVGYQITSRLRAFVGYNFLYWTNVARAGEQVDLRVNPSLVPPSLGGDPRLPAFTGQSSGFWAQGINFGLAFNY